MWSREPGDWLSRKAVMGKWDLQGRKGRVDLKAIRDRRDAMVSRILAWLRRGREKLMNTTPLGEKPAQLPAEPEKPTDPPNS